MVSRKGCRMQLVSAVRTGNIHYTWRCANKIGNPHRRACWLPDYFRVVDCYCGPLTGSPRERIWKVSHNVLQAVHKNHSAGKASSLYCVWITREGTPGSPLVAIWIDPSMRAFEEESSSAAQLDSEAVSSEEPGSCVFIPQRHRCLTPTLIKHTL